MVEGFLDVTADNWRGMSGPEGLARVNTPFEGLPVNQQTAREAYESVLADPGKFVDYTSRGNNVDRIEKTVPNEVTQCLNPSSP